MPPPPSARTGLKRFLPPIGTPAYHVLLAAVALLVLGPLGGVSAAFMNFSIGFFIGGQVLAGILGSTVTLPYGAEGKHGANYMQTMAASVAGMCGMAVLIQARHWLGLPDVPAWQLVLYYACIGMFGVGIGMLYTPILVDRMQLSFPSGLAVANILRALTDPKLLRRSVAQLGGGMAAGYAGALGALKLPAVEAIGLSASTLGAGMIVGARIAVPALVVAVIGHLAKPTLVNVGWLQPGAPYRKIGFIIALGTILGAALIDIVLLLVEGWRRYCRPQAGVVEPAPDWKRVNMFRLICWVAFWGTGVVLVGHLIMGEPVRFLLIAVGLSLLFVLVNGICLGISDSNPISSAFVMTVFVLAAAGLTDPGTGLMCASVLLIACSEGGDMQQDRSTGWRLGTNRVVQFRYQVIGIAFGAVLAVALAKIFLAAYPVLQLDQYDHKVEGSQQWQSAMTYKFVGALRGITSAKPYVMHALWLGMALGIATDLARRFIRRLPRYKSFTQSGRAGRTTDFLVDAVLLPSPYASSFGGFVELTTSLWWTAGGAIGSLYDTMQARRQRPKPETPVDGLPADMSTMSLIGGGLIAGDSLAALSVGIYGLIQTVV